MKEYLVRIPDNEVETISAVLEKFGAEMNPVQIKEKEKTLIRKKATHWLCLADIRIFL